MPDIHAYLSSGVVDAEARAARAWRRIQHKPSSITVTRGSTTLAAQTVRLDWKTVREVRGAAGAAAERELVILGVSGHPDATIEDTDLVRGDRFSTGGAIYQVKDVVSYPGEIQATAARMT